MLTYINLLPTGRAGGREREMFFIEEQRDKSLVSLEAKNRAVNFGRLAICFSINRVSRNCCCHLFGREKWLKFSHTTNVNVHVGVTLKNKIQKTNNEHAQRDCGFWISSKALLSWISEIRGKKNKQTNKKRKNTSKTYINTSDGAQNLVIFLIILQYLNI